MGNLNFDATDIAPSQAFDPLPPGWYFMRIVQAELVTSETAGQMLKLAHEIDEDKHPDFRGRKVFSNLCINHPTSEKAREIARRTLSAVAHAIGILKLANTDELLGKAVEVKLKSVPAKDGFDAKNEVGGYRASDAADAPAQPAPATKAPAPRATAPRTAGWKR